MAVKIDVTANAVAPTPTAMARIDVTSVCQNPTVKTLLSAATIGPKTGNPQTPVNLVAPPKKLVPAVAAIEALKRASAPAAKFEVTIVERSARATRWMLTVSPTKPTNKAPDRV